MFSVEFLLNEEWTRLDETETLSEAIDSANDFMRSEEKFHHYRIVDMETREEYYPNR